MTPAVILSQTQFDELTNRIKCLEHQFNLISASAEPLRTAKATAEYLRITPQGLLRARKRGDIAGVLINRKCWGFAQSQIDKYLHRHSR